MPNGLDRAFPVGSEGTSENSPALKRRAIIRSPSGTPASFTVRQLSRALGYSHLARLNERAIRIKVLFN